MLIVGQEGSPLIEMNGGSDIRAVAFAANGEYLVSGSRDGVRVWRVEDGKQMATMEAVGVQCLAVSKDGRWIAAGTHWGRMFVWDAKTRETIISHKDHKGVCAVDFSPDSTRLVSALGTASIWDIATRRRVQTLAHRDWVRAAKYSPQGDRIATVSSRFVRVWSSDGRLLVDIPVTSWRNTGLLWFNNHLFVISGSKIKQIEASTGSVFSEWPVPDTNNSSRIALPKHGEFIVCLTRQIVTFRDRATHAQLSLIQHPQGISSISVSPDDQFLAIGGRGGRITIHSVSRIAVSNLSRWIMVHMNSFLAPIIFP
jgi:WD40 repeat protein